MQTNATKLWCIASHRFADAILIHCIEESDASDAMQGPASLLRCDAIKARYDAIPMHASHQFHRWSKEEEEEGPEIKQYNFRNGLYGQFQPRDWKLHLYGHISQSQCRQAHVTTLKSPLSYAYTQLTVYK
ncbi:hypothetical protein PGT21_010833 [Puccinia graminis f. sp. tritici]|uniref:Uncharacterized protein n=1 Tax=Puccinia graminis f. sp. tritici TaxID=56615 RepID=A0A5B0M9E0_PUCGR|nr:hypothetical protein PGT21_010833 [Puccinia graminis f. sp. tritici]